MTVQTKDYLKTRFQSGDIPTQQDFVDLIDSFLDSNQANFPNPLPAVSAQLLQNIPPSTATTINVGEFNAITGAPSYLTLTSFLMPGNLVSVFTPNQRIKLIHPATTSILTVISSSYNSGTNQTTVNVLENIANTTINSCQIALITPVESLGSITRQTVGITHGSDISVATSLNIGFIDQSFNITGNSVTVTGITNRPIGDVIRLNFTGAGCILQNSATLILRNNKDIPVNQGDIFEFEKVSTGWLQIDEFTTGHYETGTWTLTVTPWTGSFGSIVLYQAAYTKIGRLVNVIIEFSIVSNGTASGGINVSLPINPVSNSVGIARDFIVSGNIGSFIINSGSLTAAIVKYDNSYLGGTGYRIIANISYLAAN